MKEWTAAFLPNRVVSRSTMLILIAVQVVIFFVIWLNSPYKVLPKPGEVLTALRDLWMTQGLGQDLITSFKLNLQALSIAAIIALLLSYVSVIPFFRPIVGAISKGRFLSLTGFSVVLTLALGGGRPVQLALLIFSITVFFVTTMAAVVASVPKAAYDHARTLRMGEGRAVWEVVILGTLDQAFEALRQNAAIGWMMLTMVEGIVRSGGGIGVALLNSNKYTRYDAVVAIQILILVVGMFQDYVIGLTKSIVCPYSEMILERKTR